MKRLLPFFLPLLLMGQAKIEEALEGSLSGRVVNAANNETIREADLVLRRADDSGRLLTPPLSYRAITDDAGRFTINRIEPGRYRLWANRSGFVPAEYLAPSITVAGTTLEIKAGQRLETPDFKLQGQSVIAGRVSNSQGEPVAGAEVRALRYRYIGRKRELSTFGTAQTNDIGDYRIPGLAAGSYYLTAAFQGTLLLEPLVQQGQTPSLNPGSYASVYYPSASGPDSATNIVVASGETRSGIDFVLAENRSAVVRGRVLTSSAGGLVTVRLIAGDQAFAADRTFLADAQGRFEITGVAPGNYTVVASAFKNGSRTNGGQRIQVDANGVDGLSLSIPAPIDITGKVQMEDGTAVIPNLRLSLRGRDPIAIGTEPTARVNSDGSFVWSGATPGVYDAVVFGLPSHLYVKSLELGGKDARKSGLDLTGAPSDRVSVVLSSRAGELEGVVVNDAQQPTSAATVVLIPADIQRRQMEQAYRVATTDQTGQYRLENIEPGDYRVFAWERAEYDAWLDPEFVKAFENQGGTVTIGEGTQLNISLRLISDPQSQ